MNIEILLKLHNDLTFFDSSIPIVVTYNNRLLFRQLNKIVAVPYFDNYYLPKKVKLGLLLPRDYTELMRTLELLIQDPGLKNGSLNTGLKPLSLVVYKLFNGLTGPQVAYNIELLSISNSFLSSIILKHSGTESKLLLKAIKNENRKRRSNRLVTDSTTT